MQPGKLSLYLRGVLGTLKFAMCSSASPETGRDEVLVYDWMGLDRMSQHKSIEQEMVSEQHRCTCKVKCRWFLFKGDKSSSCM
jgi:hypothetical protein